VGLGEAGATVYVTGRSTAGKPTLHLGGTVEDTAAAVEAAGGHAVAVALDHRDDGAVRALFDRIGADHGRLDVLVNNVWGGYEGLHRGEYPAWVSPFWEQDIGLWDPMFESGVRAHYVCSVLAAPGMVDRADGLIVSVTASSAVAMTPGDNVAYAVAKAADARMIHDMAVQLDGTGVTAVAIVPGLVRTEGIMQWAEHLDLSSSESPVLSGRVVAALAADADRGDLAGQAVTVAALADRYGLADEAS
jgi:NAD(P)-dependent dehydrogenase (short-subunit alcohol dehydrogenase family)